MKDFDFAKRLFELRKNANLSQQQLASELNITNKAISKWETGSAMPTIPQLIKLSEIFSISIDELLKKQQFGDKKIYKIVITGGPCAGKTTALSYIQQNLTNKGFFVMIIPETASELILGGITPWTIDNNLNFEYYILKQQIEKEKLFLEAAKHVANYNKVIILCDRGTLDCKSYMSKLEFNQALKFLNTNEVSLRDSYDAVFHLVTAANGAKDFYTLENNKARYETVEEALEKDQKTISAWTGHPHFRIIDNSTDFANKLKRLKNELISFLGEDVPYEIERKFLIEYPNIEKLEKQQNCQKVEIIQTYLKEKNGIETRIRQRGQNGNFTYTKTIKQKITNRKRIETEERISEKEYLTLLLDANTEKNQIRKTRYCLIYNNQYFEIDIYSFWKDKAIMEIELREENQEIDLPKQFRIIKEVTDDERFLNSSLAKNKNVKDLQ